MSTDLVYHSYAKVNLYLDVLDRRADGFHDIETIFQTVGLHDELHVAEQPRRITLTCSNQNLDTGEGNLVHRAATLLQAEGGVTHGARIHLEKQIPIAAGLAGGSGNAAAALVALNTLWGLGWPEARLRELALSLGSDVPYCMLGGTAAATGRGEELTALKPLTDLWFILLHPEIAVSAARTYNHPKLQRNTSPRPGGKTVAFQTAIDAVERGNPAHAVHNSMEVPVFSDFPHLAAARARLLEAGCEAAAMSGSGPTLFGLCATKQQATSVAEALPGFRSSIVQSVPVGVDRVR